MKHILKVTIVMLVSLTFNSCSDNEKNISSEKQNKKEVKQFNKSFDIDEIKEANNEELNLITDFTNQVKYLNKSNFNKKSDFDKPEVVNYTDLSGKAIVLNYKNENQKSNSEKSLILVASDENEIITNYEHEKIDNGSYYTINTFKEGEKWFTAEVDKNTEEIISFNFSSNVNAKMSFWECAEMAVGACVNDGECAFICGIVWQYCLGSIGLACAYVSI